jgi:hypothetical protein
VVAGALDESNWLRMPEPRMLDIGLCEQLERRWISQGAPLAGRLRPGLTERQMDELTEPLGLRLPVEARLWWGWHDGAAVGRYSVSRELGPAREFLSLSAAVEHYEQRRRMAAQAIEGAPPPMSEPDWWWHPTWLPVTNGGPTIACECSVAQGEPCPMLVVDWHEAAEWIEFPEAADPVRTGSFGEMVEIWLRALDCGAWRFDASIGHWDGDYALLDPHDEQTGMA